MGRRWLETATADLVRISKSGLTALPLDGFRSGNSANLIPIEVKFLRSGLAASAIDEEGNSERVPLTMAT